MNINKKIPIMMTFVAGSVMGVLCAFGLVKLNAIDALVSTQQVSTNILEENVKSGTVQAEAKKEVILEVTEKEITEADEEPLNTAKGDRSVLQLDPYEKAMIEYQLDGDVDFEAVLDDIQNIDNTAKRNFDSMVVLTLWSESAPEATLLWANYRPVGEISADTVSYIMENYFKSDPTAAELAFSELPSIDYQREVVKNFSSRFDILGEQETKEWVAKLPDNLKADGVVSIVQNLSRSGSIEAIEYLNQQTGVLESEQVTILAEQMGGDLLGMRKDYNEFSNIDLNSYPETLKLGLVRGAMTSMAYDSPDIASQWIEDLPKGKVRDVAVKAYIENNVSDLNQSLELATSIAKGKQQFSAVAKVVSQWYGINGAESRTEIVDAINSNARLQDENKASLLALLEVL